MTKSVSSKRNRRGSNPEQLLAILKSQLCGELVVAWMGHRSVVNKNLSYKSFSRSMHERKLRRRHHENQ